MPCPWHHSSHARLSDPHCPGVNLDKPPILHTSLLKSSPLSRQRGWLLCSQLFFQAFEFCLIKTCRTGTSVWQAEGMERCLWPGVGQRRAVSKLLETVHFISCLSLRFNVSLSLSILRRDLPSHLYSATIPVKLQRAL